MTRSARIRVSGTCCAASASTHERHAEGRRSPSSRCDRESTEDCLSSKTVMGSAAAVEQARLSETLCTSAERRRGAAPRQLVHVTEEVRVGPQSRQVLEEEGQTAALPQYGRREVLKDAMPVQQPCRRDRTDPWDAGISVGSIADEGEEIGDQIRSHPELLADSQRITDLHASAIDLDDAVTADALGEVLVGCPDADLLYALVGGGALGSGGQRVVRFELGHGPHCHSHGYERFLQRVELREERAVDADPRLVTGPETVAERLDDVIGRHADMSRTRLDHLQHRLKDADHGAEGRVRALVESAQAVEVAEKLVGAVDEMNDHGVVSGEPRTVRGPPIPWYHLKHAGSA